MDEQKQPSQMASPQTLKPLDSAVNSVLSKIQNSTPSEIGQPPRDNDTGIGKPPSAATSGAPLADAEREEALSQNQLTSIASRILSGPFIVISKTEKIRGRKKISDEFGTYWLEDEPIGEREVFSVSVPIFANIPDRALEAAFRRSPINAYLRHLTHLAMHKILGSGSIDRPILLKDYAISLSQFPEFIVWQTCKWFWENDPNKFFPKIVELTDLCEKIQIQIPLPAKMQIEKAKSASIKSKRMDQYYSNPKENPLRRVLCDFLVVHGKDDYFELDRMYSNYYLEGLAHGLGWRPEAG